MKLETVESDSPLRCQADYGNNQCYYKKLENSEYCELHDKGRTEKRERKEGVRNYRLAKWQGRVNEFADNAQIKSLREEIGILRLTLETVIDRIQDPTDMVIFSGKISDIIMKIEKLVSSCHRLETASGELLDKSKALALAGKIVEIINRHVTDSEVIVSISDEMMELFK